MTSPVRNRSSTPTDQILKSDSIPDAPAPKKGFCEILNISVIDNKTNSAAAGVFGHWRFERK